MNAAAPLQGVRVVDFSQFLSGPYCSLRLLDLGADVLKVENPDGGDLTRRIYLSGTRIGEDSTLFHAINRGKRSVVQDLKSHDGREAALSLIREADVVIQNFRPGVIERLGLGYDAARKINSMVVYGSISGYGPDGPWSTLPGQDLLAQARSGVMWLSGDRAAGPVPIGVPVADIMAGAHLAQGILAALFRRERHGRGGLVETSLLEAMVDLQFEFLTTYLNNGREAPRRLVSGSAHGYQPAPYGLYETSDGHVALAMGDLRALADALNDSAIKEILNGGKSDPGFECRDEIRNVVAERLGSKKTEDVVEHLCSRGVWCAKVLTWDELLASASFKALELVHTCEDGQTHLVKSPVRFDGLRSEVVGLAPNLPNGSEDDA